MMELRLPLEPPVAPRAGGHERAEQPHGGDAEPDGQRGAVHGMTVSC